MPASSDAPRLLSFASISELQPEPDYTEDFQILDGQLVPRALRSAANALALSSIAAALAPFNRGSRSPAAPGGWWLAITPTVYLSRYQIPVPDVAGWQRSRFPRSPGGFPTYCRPDWVGHIHDAIDASSVDLHRRVRIYAEARVPYCWVLELQPRTLTVLQLESDEYVEIVRAEHDRVVRASPFDALELKVGVLFGDDD